MKKEYQVIARKYRPQTFDDVLGQEAIVTTLKNAIKFNRIAHAYLFCGSRGTGKTTIARIFAKALNCENLSNDQEPCNQCLTCKEITRGSSLDILEIDGASHRGIDDIRQINETVGYVHSSGNYKIYIIDEVHMLTKEAFNALLKTLEEPPNNVIFFFATTEPHKVLPTILSRCQRFNLNRIPIKSIVSKLQTISKDLEIPINEDACHLIASISEGGLRDAESLLDQIISFANGPITVNEINDILGLVSKDCLSQLDKAVSTSNLPFAFELASQIFSTGKDIEHFMETLINHYRQLLMLKVGFQNEDSEQQPIHYTKDQCLYIIEMLIEAQKEMKYSSSKRILLEMTLMNIIRSSQRISIEVLVQRLNDLEKNLLSQNYTNKPSTNQKQQDTYTAEFTNENNNNIEKNLSQDNINKPSSTDHIQKNTYETEYTNKNKYDNLIHFSAVELGGTLKKEN